MAEMSEKAQDRSATTTSVDSVDGVDNEAQRPKSSSFTAKYLYHLPWTSAIELLLVICTIIGASVLVAVLNGRQQWPTSIHVGKIGGKERYMSLITPQVILSLTHSIIAFLIGLAVKDGITMAWWRRTLSGGTVKGLDRNYKFGTSLKEALLSGRHINIIAVATIGAAIAALSQGPLMQRSLTLYISSATNSVVLNTPLAGTLPRGFSGISTATSQQSGRTNILTPQFAELMRDYTSNVAPQGTVYGCNGTCTTTVYAFGFAVECSDVTAPYTYHSEGAPSIFSVSFHDDFHEVPANFVITDGAPYADDLMTLRLETYFAKLGQGVLTTTAEGAPDQICEGTMTKRSCILRPATIEYPVIIDTVQNSTKIDPTYDPLNYHVDSYHNVSNAISVSDGKMTIGGFTFALNSTYVSDYMLGPSKPTASKSLEVNMIGTLPMSYLDLSNFDINSWGNDCNQSFNDPTVDMIRAINDIALRSAIVAVNSTTVNYGYEAMQTRAVNRYKANWAYLAASLAVTILGVAMIVPAFYGWWQLGRKVSLNPIEMAEAFNAPVLQQQNAVHKDADHLLELVGDRKVKYVPVEYESPGQEGRVQKMEIVDVDATASDRPEVASPKAAKWVGGWKA